MSYKSRSNYALSGSLTQSRWDEIFKRERYNTLFECWGCGFDFEADVKMVVPDVTKEEWNRLCAKWDKEMEDYFNNQK